MDTLIRYGGSYLVEDFLLGRMGVSDARSFNDPFEFHFKPGAPLSTAEAKRRIRLTNESPAVQAHRRNIAKKVGREALRKYLRENKNLVIESFKEGEVESMEDLRDHIFTFTDEAARIVCCTEPVVEDMAENAMWAYYAGNHQGVRLHLKSDYYQSLVRWQKVSYEDSPLEYSSMRLETPERLTEWVMTLVTRKSPAWKHEREVRLLIPVALVFNSRDVKGNERSFTKLLPEHVSRIDLGIRFPDFRGIVPRIRSKNRSAEIYRAMKSPDSYSIRYERIE